MKLVQSIVVAYYRTKFKVLEIVSPHKAAKAAFELFCTPYTKRRTYEAPEVFTRAEKLSFVFQQHQIHGFGWKPKKWNGHKILVIHGFDSYSYKFDEYIDPLLEPGFEVYAFDAPAHGLSSGKTINALLYKDLILEVSRLYGPFNGMMAHSFGCIALALAVEELKTTPPNRLVFIAPATETTRSVIDFCKYLKLSNRLKNGLENLIISISGKEAKWYSVARVIQSISIPTLWLHDIKDKITPYEDMKHLRELSLSHVQFEITEGLGHSLYRDKAVAEKIVRFLGDITKEK